MCIPRLEIKGTNLKDVSSYIMVDSDSTVTDEQLVARFIGGQEPAFDELVKRYYKPLFRFLVRFTGRPHLAEDLIQDVFIKVYRSANTFDLEKKFRPWIYSVAANRARDVLRSAGRNEKNIVLRANDGDPDVSVIQLVPADPTAPDEQIIARETTQQVQDAMREMSEPLREILILAYYDQMPYKEIADMLKIPLGTVKSRLHKAVATFGEIWKRYEPDSTR